MEYTIHHIARLPSALEIRNNLLSRDPLTRQRSALNLGMDCRILTQEATALVSALRLDMRCVPSTLSLATVLTMVQGMARITDKVSRGTPTQKEHVFDECCEFYGLLQGWYAIHPVDDDFCEVLNELLDTIQRGASCVPRYDHIRLPEEHSSSCRAGGAA